MWVVSALWSCLLLLFWPWCGVISHMFSLYSFCTTLHRCFVKKTVFFLYFMSKKNTKNKQAIMTFAVLLSLFSTVLEQRTCRATVLSQSCPISSQGVISLNVSHCLFSVSCATFPPLRPCVPLIPLPCFELPESHQDISLQRRYS